MRTQLLLPRLFRPIGYVLAIPGFVLGYLVVYQKYEIPGFGFNMWNNSSRFFSNFENFTNELALMLVILGLLFVAFARVKKEDELTGRMRLNALYWGVLVNFIGYTIFLMASYIDSVYSTPISEWVVSKFGNDLRYTIYNFFLPLVIFIARFNYLLFKKDNEYANKELRLLPYRPFQIAGKVTSLILAVLVAINMIANGIPALEQTLYILPLALLLWAFAKEKDEDEYIRSLRLNAMQLAVYVNYGILLLCDLLVYGVDFWAVQILGLFTIPLIFQISFQYRLYRSRREDSRQSTTLSCL